MNKEEAQYIKMTKTPVHKLVTILAIPTVISMLITAIYSFADTFFVSKIGITEATAAVGVVFSLMAIIQAVGFTVGMGAGSIVSRLLGVRKDKEANQIAISALVSGILLGIILAVFGSIFIEDLMKSLGASKKALPYAVSYGKFILLASPIMCGSFVLNNLLRAEGKAIFSMVGLTIGGILNIVLDPIFIFALDMGIGGAALATMISQAVSFSILFSFYVRKRSIIDLSYKNISRDYRIYLEIIKVGLPSFLRQGLSIVAIVLLNTYSYKYGGDPGQAAVSIVLKIFQMLFITCLGIGQGYQPVAGYNYSSGNHQRVKKAFFYTWAITTGLMIVTGLITFVFAEDIIKIFTTSNQDNRLEVIRIGKKSLRFQCLSMAFIPLNVVCNMTFQSIGKKWRAAFLSCLRQGICFLAVVFITTSIWHLDGIIATQPIADVLTFIVSFPFMVFFLKGLDKEGEE